MNENDLRSALQAPKAAPGTPRKQRRQRKAGCPHLLQVWDQVPHPKYGDRMPHYVPRLIPDPFCAARA